MSNYPDKSPGSLNATPNSLVKSRESLSMEETRNRAVSIDNRLKLCFASLSCLGGIVLGYGSDTSTISAVAIFFSVFGYVFVDYLRLFALPPIAAYAAMAVAAFYCVSDFTDLNAAGNQQMMAVAQLLVFVQAILMLQRKSRRIFEQLCVFCLLELIVAAVFNNALNYGLLLFPIGLIGAWALTLLAVVSATSGIDPAVEIDTGNELPVAADPSGEPNVIEVTAPESAASLYETGFRLPWIASVTLVPAVLLVAAIFFYALPRTTGASRTTDRGSALVGFSNQMHLEQMGQMLQNSSVALRVYLRRATSGKPYVTSDGIYLRGRVLERYQSHVFGGRSSASWSAAPSNVHMVPKMAPPVFEPIRNDDPDAFDQVTVSVVCEPMRNDSLFAISPYYRAGVNDSLIHHPNRWTLSRRVKNKLFHPRTTYRFGTVAFRSGVQTNLTARDVHETSVADPESLSPAKRRQIQRDLASVEHRQMAYVDTIREFNIDIHPTAAELAEQLVHSPDGTRMSDYQIAQRLSRYLSSSPEFQYTLNLDAATVPGLDPIEQFLSVDRKGHCQYFASALVMMLRSQEIPARVVLGYYTDEFNDIGEHYVARQLHAHSWVEALIDREDLPPRTSLAGQPEAKQYWLRLDPTPSAGLVRESSRGMRPYLDVAQTMWDNYVVDMEGDRRGSSGRSDDANPIHRSYSDFVEWVQLKINRIKAGQLGGGSLAYRNLFSWPAALAAIVLGLLLALGIRLRSIRWPLLARRRRRPAPVAEPEIEFYARALAQLSRAGINRHAAQTPGELVHVATQTLAPPQSPHASEPLDYLTRVFYRLRFRDNGSQTPGANGGDLEKDIQNGDARHSPEEVERALAELKQHVDYHVSGVTGSRLPGLRHHSDTALEDENAR